jgi:hypothetical protein
MATNVGLAFRRLVAVCRAHEPTRSAINARAYLREASDADFVERSEGRVE